MPQNPLAANTAINTSNAYASQRLDAQNELRVEHGGVLSALNITAATVVKATPGRLVRINVLVAGSTAGSANDCATTGTAAIGNQIAAIPASVGQVGLEWPCLVGIVVTPGTGQTLTVAYV
jgi:hypothetical protein